MHHIQRNIINKLMHVPSLNYAEMRPKGVESNHFAYHLDQLVRSGLVAKQDRSYALTTDGLALADRLSHEKMTVRIQPHIVTSIHLTNDSGQTLLFRHAFQPYLNLYGYPQGRIHYEEKIAEAAGRELMEKTGLTDIPLTHRGMLYIYTAKHGNDVSKILAHVFSGSVVGAPPLTVASDKGAPLWGEARKYKASQCMPGFWDIKKLLAKNTSLFFAEVNATLA